MAKMNPVVHFEMPSEDKNRMANFYTKVFGWQTKMLGPEMGDYVLVTTSESDPNDLTGRPKNPGTINGGFFGKTKDNQHITVVIAVDDIRKAMKNIENAGGKILGGMNPGEPDDIPGVGLYCAFIDTEGNRVSVLQPKGM
ncbi:MAG TPA: VOC family protein [Ignavibacteria bacterium]|nr:VOC family protein [Ignavibacteria bacterium]